MITNSESKYIKENKINPNKDDIIYSAHITLNDSLMYFKDGVIKL